MKFEEFPFQPLLQKAITEIGFVDCTPVQAQSFTAYFEGKDIYAQSQTGTGKTAAFMLCGVQELIQRNRMGSANDDQKISFAGDIKMLILSPTRELAQQIVQEAKLLAQFLPLQIAAFYGGVGYEKQHTQLSSGVQIITGTPGRIIDLAKSGQLLLNQVQIMVLDEADRMLDMGFIEDVHWLMKQIPPAAERLTMLYSATLSPRVGNLTWEFMREGLIAEIIIEPEQITTKNVEQELYHVSKKEKLNLLLSLIQKHGPSSAIIFCNTKRAASFVEGRLRANGYQVKLLIGDLPQPKRTHILGQLKAGRLRFVVATDVASRGLHIDGLPMVINYDLPDEAENYVHRIGRTARAGAHGKAISLACEHYVYNLTDIERYIEDKVPVAWLPEEELIQRPLTPQKSRHSRGRESMREAENHSELSAKRNTQLSSERSTGRRTQANHSRNFEDRGSRKPRRQPERQRSSRENRNRHHHTTARKSKHEGAHSEARIPSKMPPKDPNERLKYYQQKYGEDFGALQDSSTNTSNAMAKPDDAAHKRRKHRQQRLPQQKEPQTTQLNQTQKREPKQAQRKPIDTQANRQETTTQPKQQKFSSPASPAAPDTTKDTAQQPQKTSLKQRWKKLFSKKNN